MRQPVRVTGQSASVLPADQPAAVPEHPANALAQWIDLRLYVLNPCRE